MRLAKPSISKLIVMGVATAMCSAALTAPAFADEAGTPEPGSPSSSVVQPRSTEDSLYNFVLTGSSTTDGTPFRSKDDASASYVRCDYIGEPLQLFVDAPGDVNCTVNDRAYLSNKGELHVKQNVYEWGYRLAQLTSWRSGSPTTSYGVWSSDSWGTYPVINAGF